MVFRIIGLSAEPFQHLYYRSEAELAQFGVKRYQVDQNPCFPDRIELRDAAVGETVLLLNHVSQPADTPYHARHAIFIREGAVHTYDAVDQVPEALRRRLLSLRAFSVEGMMLDADVVEGREIEAVIARLFANHEAAYIHAHNARQGCYMARIERA